MIVDDMMFDIGVPYGFIRDDLYNIKYLFLTHRHTDHINKKTIQRVVKEFPRITIIGNYDVADIVKCHHFVGDETEIELKDRKVIAFKAVHDVPCSGYVVQKDDKNLIYTTDTATMEHAPKLKYDYFFIESNHDAKKIEAIRNSAKKDYGYDVWQGAMRHLSTQDSRTFYFLNRKSKDSEWIELHKSERFY